MKPSQAKPTSRGRERDRRLIGTVATGIIARVVQTAVALLLVPILIHHLGQERYGVWETLVSLVALLGLVAQGIGNGLVQRLAEAAGAEDREAMTSAVSSAAALLLVASVVAVVVYGVAHVLIDFSSLLDLSGVEARAELGPTMTCFAAVFAFNLTWSFVPRTQYGLQDGHIAALWQITGSILAFAATMAAVQLSWGMPGVVVSMLGVPGLVIAFGGVVYIWGRRHLLPRIRQVSSRAVRQILAIGWLSFVFQAIQTISLKLDNILVLGFLGASEVVALSVPMRLFVLVQTVNLLLISALWPAYGEAIARGDRLWVRRTFRRALSIMVPLATLAAILLPLAGPWVIGLWVGDAVAPTRSLLAGIGVLSLLLTCGSLVTSLLNGAGLFRPQVVMAVGMLVVALVLKILLIGRFGIVALPWVMAGAYATCYLGPALWYASVTVLQPSEER